MRVIRMCTRVGGGALLAVSLFACGEPLINSTPNPAPNNAPAPNPGNVSVMCLIVPEPNGSLPTFDLSINNSTPNPIDVNGLTIVGYSAGQEVGSTNVSIGDIIVSGQVVDFTATLPDNWTIDTPNPGAVQDTFTAIPDTCNVLSYN